ncbi:hypothetical protein SAMN04489761_3376 [Tenacibaculum sp. MAR_2009_124]|uniref:hypothetical protein n=1 Tax=Tenacibaculum sp. MAR_2009_124 TaxID=1250059 RepID=UPI0008959E99|nr:hypothetical protein [Tenacibaculum sp. MAR_2009_124]SEC64300.1 hypothetical protein SAMN04489761_3376 [Tenacibaculum sp. MAR_2009_124]
MNYDDIKKNGYIDKINTEVNFPMYLKTIGFDLYKKSAGSMEFRKKNSNEKIVLNTSRDIISYFDRNDSENKGYFFKFLRNYKRLNFFEAVKEGLEIINRAELINIEELKVTKRVKSSDKSLENNYNITDLKNPRHLVVDRHISRETLESPYLKGRIFNAYHINDNGSRIPNIAFPKYDSSGIIKNYIVYNKPYLSKKTDKVEKFRVVLNNKDRYLFYTNPNLGKTDTIYFAEDGKDLAAHIELKNPKNAMYFSFGGNVYKEKLEEFSSNILPRIVSNPNIQIHSITDNDAAGFSFDVSVYTHMTSELNKEIMVTTGHKDNNAWIMVHYNNISDIEKDYKYIKSELEATSINTVLFKDKVKFEYQKKHSNNEKGISIDNKRMLSVFNKVYLPIKGAKLEKSVAKDWNDDLIIYKKNRVKSLNSFTIEDFERGDRIKLKSEKGPEGTSNEGIVNKKDKEKLVVDFGLNHQYIIPLDAINILYKSHYKVADKSVIEKKNNNLKL